jgi:hypothetical protein
MKLLGFIAALVGVGCSGASAVDTCKRQCAKSIACSGGTTTELANCQQSCDSGAQQAISTCTNASDVLSCQNGCLDLQNCNDVAKCASGCPKCITDSGAVDLAGSSSSADLAVGSMQMQFCSAYCTKASGCTGGNETQCQQACNGQTSNLAPCAYACFNNCLTKSCSELNPCIGACGMMPACM